MLYWLTNLSDGGDFFNLFRYITFRAGGAFMTALIFGFLFGKPLISVLLPTYETSGDILRETLDSVIAQLYPEWELCIADDGSTQPHVRKILEAYARRDKRIHLSFHDGNTGIGQSKGFVQGL